MKIESLTIIAQDEWSLSRPKFKNKFGSVLTVIGYNGMTQERKRYYVTCSVCIKDKELYNSGIFSIDKRKLLAGQIPCGCNKTHKKNERQWKIICKRLADSLGYDFLGFNEEFKNSKTLVKYFCKEHGTWLASISNLQAGKGCYKCGRLKVRKHYSKFESKQIEQLKATKDCIKGTTFWKSDTIDCKGSNSYWKYTCPKCSNDEYVKAGVCTGIFEDSFANLKLGYRRCRCSSRWKPTTEQKLFKIQTIIKCEELDYEFISWVNGYQNARSSFIYYCKSHGQQVVRANNFIDQGNRCPECKGLNQNYFYVNLVINSDNIPVAIKYGITINPERRIKEQNKTNNYIMKNIYIFKFSNTKICKETESYCKKLFNNGFLKKKDMPSGYTETTSIKNLGEIKNICILNNAQLIYFNDRF